MLTRRNVTKCFTLVELLVVIAIISILAGMLLPALEKARDTANMAKCMSNQKQLATTIAFYSEDFENYLPHYYYFGRWHNNLVNLGYVAGDQKLSVPVRLDVSSLVFPEKVTLDTCLWDYAIDKNYGITDKNWRQAISMQREYLVTVPNAGSGIVRFPELSHFDKDEKLVVKPDFSRFDAWVAEWPGANRYKIFYHVLPGSKFAGHSPGTPGFERAVSEWCAAWDSHLKEKGFPSGKVMLNLLDEPNTEKTFQTQKMWASTIKKHSKMLHIFCDPIQLDKLENLELAAQTLDMADVLCPGTVQFPQYNRSIRKIFTDSQAKGRELWFYMCSGPTRHYDPAHYRLQAWHVFVNDGTGSGFWAFADTGKVRSSWNPYIAPGAVSYAIPYIEPDRITPSKQLEAVREGAQDYEYLVMLREKLGSEKARAFARSMADRAIKQGGVHYSTAWQEKSYCRFAEESRLRILDMLEK